MATKRVKDIIKRVNENYINTVKGDYAELMEGQYVPITYYQIDDFASTHDNNLETLHSQLGKNSPYKYRRIYDVSLYGVNPLDLTNNIADRGLLTMVNNEGYFLPNTIIPVAGDFFSFDLEEISDHLFQVTDVQFSDAGPSKYYKITYSIYQENVEIIFSNVVDDFVIQEVSDGSVSGSSIITTAAAAQSDSLKVAIDNIIKNYINDYYDEETNSFIYRSDDAEGSLLWSGYLQHFLCQHNVLDYFNKKIMTEIYLLDVNGFDNRDIYNENVYRKSLFKAVEQQRNTIGDLAEYMMISYKNLRVRNLPFFFSQLPYKLLDMGTEDAYLYTNGFHFLLGNELEPYSTVDKMHIFYAEEDLNDPDRELHIKEGDLLYHMPYEGILPIDIYYVAKGGYVLPASLKEMISSDDEYDNNFIFNLIRKYINKGLSLDNDLVAQMEDFYGEISLKNYILIPVLIYILKDLVNKANK